MPETIKADVQKVGSRQSKDGNQIVSFGVHPNDVTLDLLNAPPGSMWRMILEPLDEFGNAPAEE